MVLVITNYRIEMWKNTISFIVKECSFGDESLGHLIVKGVVVLYILLPSYNEYNGNLPVAKSIFISPTKLILLRLVYYKTNTNTS